MVVPNVSSRESLVFGFSFGVAEFGPNKKEQIIEAISNEGLQSIKAESTPFLISQPLFSNKVRSTYNI